MIKEDRNRLAKSISSALRILEQDAQCFCYADEPEYRELVELMKKHQRKLNNPFFSSINVERLKRGAAAFEKYKWAEQGRWMTDGHAWSCGIDFGRCPKEPTGETVTLRCPSPIFARRHETIEVDCQIYRVNSGHSFLRMPGNPVEWLYIALGEFRGYPMIFHDEITYKAYMAYENATRGK